MSALEELDKILERREWSPAGDLLVRICQDAEDCGRAQEMSRYGHITLALAAIRGASVSAQQRAVVRVLEHCGVDKRLPLDAGAVLRTLGKAGSKVTSRMRPKAFQAALAAKHKPVSDQCAAYCLDEAIRTLDTEFGGPVNGLLRTVTLAAASTLAETEVFGKRSFSDPSVGRSTRVAAVEAFARAGVQRREGWPARTTYDYVQGKDEGIDEGDWAPAIGRNLAEVLMALDPVVRDSLNVRS